jgi:hypothetical protein
MLNSQPAKYRAFCRMRVENSELVRCSGLRHEDVEDFLAIPACVQMLPFAVVQLDRSVLQIEEAAIPDMHGVGFRRFRGRRSMRCLAFIGEDTLKR